MNDVAVDLETLSLDETLMQSCEIEGERESDEEESDILLRFQRTFLRDRSVCQPALPHNVIWSKIEIWKELLYKIS